MPRMSDMERSSRMGALKRVGRSWKDLFKPSPDQEKEKEVQPAPKEESEEDARRRKEREHDRNELNDLLK